MPVWKTIYKAMPAVATPAAAVAAKGGAAAAGEGSSASSISQVNTQSITTGAITVNGTTIADGVGAPIPRGVSISNSAASTASSSQTNVVLNHVTINGAVALDNSTATTTTK
jgi:hypothetical protein